MDLFYPIPSVLGAHSCLHASGEWLLPDAMTDTGKPTNCGLNICCSTSVCDVQISKHCGFKGCRL